MASSERFGNFSGTEITIQVQRTVPKNTVNTQTSIWRQFAEFCKARNYQLVQTTPIEELANILKDWAFNMKKVNGDDYKEYVVKTLWNTVAKLLQEKYYKEFHIKIDPFNDIRLKEARDARNAKRLILQEQLEKRKCSSKAVTRDEIFTMARQWNEEEPKGLQKKFYHVAAFELAWRGGEAAYCKIFYFKEEKSNDGTITGRYEYNPVFSKTCQGGAKKLSDSKYLASNMSNNDICPVHLLKKLLEKRGENIKSDLLFLAPNPFWQKQNSKGWYKDMPIGVNEIAKWTKQSAEQIGLDTKKQKITNHSNRAAAVTELSKSGVNNQELIKITGHSSSSSIKSYLQLDKDHHGNILTAMRGQQSVTSEIMSKSEVKNNENQIIYQNCTFNNCSFNTK